MEDKVFDRALEKFNNRKLREPSLVPYLLTATEIYKTRPEANHINDKYVVERVLAIAKLLRDGDK